MLTQARHHLPAIIGFGVPFLIVLYLALREGGYGEIARDGLGVAAWLAILFGTLAGVLPIRHPGRLAAPALAILVTLLAWTTLALLWTESDERTAYEIARVAILLGVFVLALCLDRRGSLRLAAAAIAAAIAIVALLALASRTLPDLFGPNKLADGLPTEVSRLAYPLNYWNGLAALMSLGVPLLAWLSFGARSLPLRAVSCAAIPVLALVSYYTLSRGGAVEGIAGVAVMLVLLRQRLPAILPISIATLASSLLIVLASRRSELVNNTMTDAARDQGIEMLLATVGVCAAAGVANFLLQRSIVRGSISVPALDRGLSRRLLAGAAALLVIGMVAVNMPAKAADSWEEFKQPVTPSGESSRFQALGGSGRYQWWGSAIGAAESEPILGIGPGTFQYWFARDDVPPTGFVRDAHSLYLEMWAELGPLGLLLALALVGGAVALAVRRTLQARGVANAGASALPAAVTGSLAAFAVGAAIDWSWEMTVLPVCFLLLTAGLIGGSDRPLGRRLRLTAPCCAAVALVLIVPPMASSIYLGRSEQAAADGRLVDALHDARRASALLPFAATPLTQQAQIMQLGGLLDEAAETATEATERESTNWKPWYALSQIETEREDPAAAAAAFEEARSLNPRSSFLAQPPPG